MQELHQTLMGRRLIEHDIPEIHVQLKRIADALEVLTKKPSRYENHSSVYHKLKIEKIKPGEYKVHYKSHVWRVYRESIGTAYWWYAECTAEDHNKAFRVDSKSDALEKLKASYVTN